MLFYIRKPILHTHRDTTLALFILHRPSENDPRIVKHKQLLYWLKQIQLACRELKNKSLTCIIPAEVPSATTKSRTLIDFRTRSHGIEITCEYIITCEFRYSLLG